MKIFYRTTLIVTIFLLLQTGPYDKTTGCSGASGCSNWTKHKSVETKTEIRTVNQLDIKITVDKVRHKKVMPNDDQTKKTYTIIYTLEIPEYNKLLYVCEHDVDEDADINKELSDFRIQFSSTGKHIAVGVGEYVFDFIHLFHKGMTFYSGGYYAEKMKIHSGLKFSDIEWSIFPDPDNLIDSLAIENKKYTQKVSTYSFAKILSNLEPGNSHDLFFINNWYNETAEYLFDKQRVKSIIEKSKEWEQIAVCKSLKILNDTTTQSREMISTRQLLLYTNNREALLKTDSLFITEFRFKLLDNYYTSRKSNTEIPLSLYVKKMILETARKDALNYPSISKKFNIDFEIEYLNENNENQAIKDFIVLITEPEFCKTNIAPLLNQAIKKEKNFSSEIKELLLARSMIIMENPPEKIPNYELKRLFVYISNNVSCEISKRLYEKHKERIGKVSLPAKCR